MHLPTQVPNGNRAATSMVADAMIHHPKVWGPEASVAEVRRAFENDHLHAVLVADSGVLLAVVAREDLATSPGTYPAWRHGRLRGRTIGPHADLARVHARMLRERCRRLAVVDHRSTLLGLLCLKRSGCGFCADSDVAARAAERAGQVRS
jgi:hypothetical protein